MMNTTLVPSPSPAATGNDFTNISRPVQLLVVEFGLCFYRRLVTYPKGREGDTDGYLSLYLQLADPESLPPGWSKEVNFTLTVVFKRFGKLNRVLGGGQCCFNAEDTSWVHNKFISLTKLHSKGRGFLVKNKLTIVAELHVFPEENVSIAAPLSSKDETQADEKAEDADLVVDNAASEEGSDDDDDGTSDWVTDNDGSFEEDVENFDVSSSCGDMSPSPLDQSNALEDAETEVFNEFDFSPSQVESVSHIFRRHPDIAIGFRPRNGQIRRAYMNELLSLIEMLRQSPEKLSEDDLSDADDTLADLIDVGFRLDWLKTKLNEVAEKKKKKEQTSGARLQSMEEQLRKLKLMFLDLRTQLLMEKTEALVARAPLSFNDVVS
ncbi:hypothetical protein Bca4012_039304 [Brassica carinata]|uniref:MATH domain-containing protein n=1 Tax=Brassica carinata TaxID=52824 RepID=A0A8X8B7Y6_BRACI|nr:hypothetical protein Bca52824_007530 [Brassica carinata]